MPVFPCLLYSSAVRSSTFVHFLDAGVIFVVSSLFGDCKKELTQLLMRSSLFLLLILVKQSVNSAWINGSFTVTSDGLSNKIV